MNKTKLLCKILLLWLMIDASWGCSGVPVPGMPGGRKKLPGDETYIVVPLPDAAGDSATMSLINTYKPLAVPLLTQWAQQQNAGIMIDLRADQSQLPQRAEYLVQRHNEFSIPVVFLWDYRSAGRATGFMNELETFSAVTINRIGGSNLQSGYGNCFQP